jgi:hypothetical protein
MAELRSDVLDQIARAAAPLMLGDRDPFIRTCITLLKQALDPGPGTVNRIIRGVLALGTYRRATFPHVGPRGRHGKPSPADGAA